MAERTHSPTVQARHNSIHTNHTKQLRTTDNKRLYKPDLQQLYNATYSGCTNTTRANNGNLFFKKILCKLLIKCYIMDIPLRLYTNRIIFYLVFKFPSFVSGGRMSNCASFLNLYFFLNNFNQFKRRFKKKIKCAVERSWLKKIFPDV